MSSRHMIIIKTTVNEPVKKYGKPLMSLNI